MDNLFWGFSCYCHVGCQIVAADVSPLMGDKTMYVCVFKPPLLAKLDIQGDRCIVGDAYELMTTIVANVPALKK